MLKDIQMFSEAKKLFLQRPDKSLSYKLNNQINTKIYSY